MPGRLLILVCVLLLAGCSKPPAAAGRADSKDVRAEVDWQIGNGTRLGATTLRLREGSCLDSRRLPKPWVQLPYNQRRTLKIAAPGAATRILPYERRGFPTSFDGDPLDGKVRVLVSGWSPPPNGAWGFLVRPVQFQDDIRTRMFRPISNWPRNAWLEGFEAPGAAHIFADRRRYTQCRSFGPTVPEVCGVISADDQYEFTVELDVRGEGDLPGELRRIAAAVAAMRGSCPAERSAPQ